MRVVFLLVSLSFGSPVYAADENPPPSPAPTVAPSIEEQIKAAEAAFYAFDDPLRLTRVEADLLELQRVAPRAPYPLWALARVAFFRREGFYIRTPAPAKDEADKEKLRLASTCHRFVDQCLDHYAANAECHLMKGACWSMEAATWGASFQTLRILKPMDEAFTRAMELPSDFSHGNGVTTRQLAQIFRGILYRMMPESWWFKLIAGRRGNKEQAYAWLREAVTGPLAHEPMLILESAVGALCLGKSRNLPDKIAEGRSMLEAGLQIPSRDLMDEFDKKHVQFLLANPNEACNYRREKIEDLSEKAISNSLK